VAHEAAALARQALDLAAAQLSATDARVRAGEAPSLDLRLARLDQARVAAELLRLRSTEAEALAALSTLAQRPVDGTDLLGDPWDAAPAPSAARDAERSDVRAARMALEAAEAGLARERAATLPPVTLGAFYADEGHGAVAGPSVGLTLPLWHQNQGAIGEARGGVSIAQAELDASSARAEAERRTTADAFAEAASTMAGVPGTPEDATAALGAIEASVRSGELDLVATILLRAEVIAGQSALSEARGELALSRIRLLLAMEDPVLLGPVGR
jgi:outer membrane protein TolC